jgi:hypothetical protein
MRTGVRAFAPHSMRDTAADVPSAAAPDVSPHPAMALATNAKQTIPVDPADTRRQRRNRSSDPLGVRNPLLRGGVPESRAAARSDILYPNVRFMLCGASAARWRHDDSVRGSDTRKPDANRYTTHARRFSWLRAPRRRATGAAALVGGRSVHMAGSSPLPVARRQRVVGSAERDGRGGATTASPTIGTAGETSRQATPVHD